ncbi:uncharacterized protein PHALS_09396 [Plasmopara halstedii]|uniref:Uncharacterized protein n=1 Tax=Plasmopara halstedii TaxID=4781 RepID=A0A0P1A4R7_PLAHL|nr:uncharacterized protein PHALS_09396 [Plasmopara halstedii]CEG35269.1 hypothetical protein PHALS_09396 [Plasmopara halstedii]|eukprot:XP_024571638.1 hypothetical protein PHALS_09396 [Plasmopara halstedii]
MGDQLVCRTTTQFCDAVSFVFFMNQILCKVVHLYAQMFFMDCLTLVVESESVKLCAHLGTVEENL